MNHFECFMVCLLGMVKSWDNVRLVFLFIIDILEHIEMFLCYGYISIYIFNDTIVCSPPLKGFPHVHDITRHLDIPYYYNADVLIDMYSMDSC